MGTLPEGEKPRKRVLTEEQKARARERNRAWEAKNAEMLRVRRREKYEANKEAILAKHKAYYEANKSQLSASNRAWREKNRDRTRETNRRWHEENREQHRRGSWACKLRAEYGLTLEQHEAMIEAQGGRCAICLRKRKLCVDHDHETGKVRALLCRPCNTMLGNAEDVPNRLRAAAKYLEKHGTKPAEHEVLPLFTDRKDAGNAR